MRVDAARPPSVRVLLVALAIGWIAGAAAQGTYAARGVREVATAWFALWASAVLVIAIPMVAAHLYGALDGLRRGTQTALLRRALGWHCALLLGAALVACLVGWALRPALDGLAPGALPALDAGAVSADGEGALRLPAWLPDRPLGTGPKTLAVTLTLFACLAAAVAAGLLSARAGERAQPLRRAVDGLRRGTTAALAILVALLPVSIAALAFQVASRRQWALGGYLLAWVLGCCAVCAVVIALLYPVGALLGRAGWRPFARAALPAQEIAIASRSSLAALPGLLAGIERHLGGRLEAARLVVPVAGVLFKLNRSAASIFKLYFLAATHGLPLDAGDIAFFFVIVSVLSFGTPGIPGVGRVSALPLYLASGVPLEAVLILEAVDTLPDIFKTLLNTTGQMTVVALASRDAAPPEESQSSSRSLS